MPLILLLVALLFVHIAYSATGRDQVDLRSLSKGDPEPMKRPQRNRPGLADEGYPEDSWDRAQADLDQLQAQEADRLRTHVRELRAELIRARQRKATPERIHRLRELQTVTLIMLELLQEEDEDE